MKLKRKILCFIVVSLMAANLCGCEAAVEEAEEIQFFNSAEIEEKSFVLENEKYKFTLDAETTQFTLEDKGSGYVWNSSAQDIDTDAIASKSMKDILNSTLSVQYTNTTAATVTIDNFSTSISGGLFNVTSDGGSIKVDYTIGVGLEKVFILPKAVPESRFMEFYDKMERKSQKKVEQYYRVIDINNLLSTQNKDELLALYPDLANEKMYVLGDDLADYLMTNIQGYFEAAGYTMEDYEADIARYEASASDEKPTFNISMIYTLNDDGFSVRIPMSEIEYMKTYPLTKVSVLPYFGSAGTTDEGYMIVPDGSGGLINFNNGKTDQSAYFNSVYGWDYGTNRTALINEDILTYPVFGISRDDDASFICVIEDGCTYANVEADVSGKLNSFNNVNASYVMIHSEDRDVTAKSDKTVRVFEKALPAEDLVQRYIFSEDAGYMSMAESYREYLLERYPTMKKQEDGSLPTTVEIIGAVDSVKHIMGIPANLPDPMTTYDEALELVKSLDEAGFENYNIKYNGAFNGGVVNKPAEKAKTTSVLGSASELKDFIKYCSEQGNDLFFESDFTFIHKNKAFDGFIAFRDATKYVSHEIAELYPFWNVTYAQNDENEEAYFFARPDYTVKLARSFTKDLTSKYGTSNVAFGGIGKYIGADYNTKTGVSRQATLNMQTELLDELRGSGSKMMFYAGNDYILPYADFITEMKLDSNSPNIVDEEIPFYCIAIHGLVPYAGNAVNMSSDFDKNILKTLETGAGLYFMFMDEPSLTLQDGSFTKYYSTDYNLWKEESAEIYNDLSSKLGGIYSQYIVNHTRLADNVYQTEYEDGTKVTVNYRYVDYSDGGITVKARDYLIERG